MGAWILSVSKDDPGIPISDQYLEEFIELATEANEGDDDAKLLLPSRAGYVAARLAELVDPEQIRARSMQQEDRT